MIPKLRRKFISITAAALFAVILLVITTINCVFMLQTNRQLDFHLNRIMDTHYPEILPPEDDSPQNPEPMPPHTTNPDIPQPDTTNPDTMQSHVAVPNTIQSDAAVPDTMQTHTAVSDTIQTDTAVPNTTQPHTAVPDTIQSDAAIPDTMQTHTAVPDTIENAPNHIPRKGHFDNTADLFRAFDVKLQIRFDGCLIFLNADGTIKEIRQDAAEHYDEEELQLIAADICQKGKETGWYQYFKYRMVTQISPDGTSETKLGLINASSDLYSIFTMLLISVTIGIFSFLLVLLIIIFASGKAVKPIEESYTRQKQFVTDAGHELKTPLTVISADNELSKMIYGNCEWFDSIDNQVTKMNSLIRSLITLARMDEGETLIFAPFNLSDAVYDTAKSFEHLIHANGKLITFDITDDIIYSGDESKLRQVVSILMDNAAKYCDINGKIAVKLTAEKYIRLQIINDYTQAADCDLSRVFERFYRADKARTPDGSYGLGLSIAKSIIELHKGKIHARALEHDRLMFEILLNHTARK